MQIRVDKSDLTKALNTVLKAVPNSTTMPILYGVVIETGDGIINLITNDMSIGIETKIEAEVIEGGKICVDAKTFTNMIKKLPNKLVEIITGKEVVEIRSGKSTYELATLDVEEFPRINDVVPECTINIDAITLQGMIKRTCFSVSNNFQNKVLTGELLEVKNGRLRIAACDMVRVAVRQTELATSSPDVRVIIPGKTMSDLASTLNNGDVTIEIGKNNVRFVYEAAVFTSRLIDGKYFNIDQLINKTDYNTVIKADREELTSLLDRVSIVTQANNITPSLFEISGDKMNVTKVSNTSKFSEDIDVEKDGGDMKIGLNSAYVMDALKSIEEVNVKIGLFNDKSPVMIVDDLGEYVYVVLPVNI